MLLYIDFQRDLDDLMVADLIRRGYVQKPEHSRIAHFVEPFFRQSIIRLTRLFALAPLARYACKSWSG